MKKLFLVDAYALIFKYYYAFLGRPMRNREGMNTSVVFGFVKFLRDIQKRERPDLLGVAFDPKGGSFRRDIFPEYKANRSETPEDILLSIPYVKRVLDAMCIPILEVAGYEADDVIGTLSQKGVEAGYDVYMVTPDKDYGQLVRDNCRIYKQRGAEGSIEIVDREAIREKYGIDDPQLVRDILALWGDASDNIPGVPGIGEKIACKLVREWGTVENILDNVSKIKGKQGEKIAGWADNLRLAKRLTTICLDVPIPFREEDLTVCDPHIDQLRGIFAELDFKAFMNDLTNLAPAEPLPEGPRQEAQTQLAEMARAKSAAAKKAALAGQGNLFGDPVVPLPAAQEVPVAELQAEAEAMQFRTAQTTPHEYTLVETAAQLREVVAAVGRYPEFCFDTETTGFDIFNDRIVGLSLAVEPFKAWYVPFLEKDTPEYAEIVRPLFEDEKIAKIGQNIKFDLMVLRRLGITIRGRMYDTMILHYLLDPESRHNMNALAEKYLNYKPIEIETLIGKGSKQLTMDLVNVERVKEYAAEDADVTLQLKQALYPMIEQIGLQHLYFEIEEPMIAVLADIEMAGVRIDSEALAVYAVELNRKLAELEAAIRTEAGEPNLNINSARQLGEVLFGKMRIAEKPKMTKTKQFCTDEDYLQSFARKHRIVDLILEYRGVKKLLSTYVEALPQLVNRSTGRIHTSFNQAVTATGRLSSTNPNLQNIPVRDDMGRRIRKAFIPSDDDHLLLSADYSQVELRLMAHLSGDESLIAAFEHGEDIHAATAAKLFNKTLDEVTSEERRRAKTANFGIIYGISAFGLSQRLEIPRKEAKEIIDGYFASYPGVKKYMDNVVEKAKEEGFVSTIFGRRRYLNDIASHNAIARGLAERNAVNAPIQGSAADIMKIAMINVHRRFAAEGIRSRVILQVHDELVVDMLRSEQERVTAIVTECMESAAQLKVRLIADAGVGGNWLEAH
ncbi:DNA polymerase I [Alistipes shahii]|jgi:DNA-directed DNA polymerase|uniref:DNA polymerase I n=1 Tax=Alistipes shahii TaxID=328814 RepID=A0A5B3GFA1_9BACT|nr:DNA polymerase I [Alistipes shahii]KAA2372150.1 DNA polymerase I [Alistipes shahii]MCO7105072.1 DNA polymerase I [Alistipes shahii]MCQ5072883.1 DNA polymerase I [Alistipes shahii]